MVLCMFDYSHGDDRLEVRSVGRSSMKIQCLLGKHLIQKKLTFMPIPLTYSSNTQPHPHPWAKQISWCHSKTQQGVEQWVPNSMNPSLPHSPNTHIFKLELVLKLTSAKGTFICHSDKSIKYLNPLVCVDQIMSYRGLAQSRHLRQVQLSNHFIAPIWVTSLRY